MGLAPNNKKRNGHGSASLFFVSISFQSSKILDCSPLVKNWINEDTLLEKIRGNFQVANKNVFSPIKVLCSKNKLLIRLNLCISLLLIWKFRITIDGFVCKLIRFTEGTGLNSDFPGGNQVGALIADCKVQLIPIMQVLIGMDIRL
jgi:hypothetical protein